MNILHIDKNHPFCGQPRTIGIHTNTEGFDLSREEVLGLIDQYQGVVIRSRIFIDREFLDAAKNLKFIARVGAGLDAIDTTYAKKRHQTHQCS